MSQYVKIMKDDELYHYGVIGMKWGRRRALNAAKTSGRAEATAKIARKEAGKTVSIYNQRAKSAEASATELAGRGKLARSLAVQTYAEANRKRANETREEGRSYEKYYERLAASKRMKANKLAEKYGDAETKKQVELLIKENSKKPYSLTFDDTDPLVTAIQEAYEYR